MKKTAFIALSLLVASSTFASAQGFDLNAMPLGQFPTATDTTPTGSIGAQLKKRVVERDGVAVTQFYTVAANGDVTIVSEEKN